MFATIPHGFAYPAVGSGSKVIKVVPAEGREATMYSRVGHSPALNVVPHRLLQFKHEGCDKCAIVMPYLPPLNHWATSPSVTLDQLAQALASLAQVRARAHGRRAGGT